MAPRRTVVVVGNVVGWTAVHVVAGYAAHRLPLERLQADGLLLRVRPYERALYERLGIRRWKDRLPEAGAVFAGGMSKREIPKEAGRRAGVARYVAETRRAELAHWWAVAALPVFALWNPPAGVAGCTVYAVAANAPCIAVQRYNRARGSRALARSSGSRPVDRALPRTTGSSMP